ncbi:FAD:protein FMN transferase [candidate division KSB1 bacterium]|nr:FAD:protein FMN transferase [candidate division KSB1 bacterium]
MKHTPLASLKGGILFAIALCLIMLSSSATFSQISGERLFEVTASKHLFGASVDILAYHPEVQSCKLAFYHAFKEMERIERLLSSQLSTSEIARVNRNAGREPVKVSYETFALLKRAVRFAQRSEGAFDVSIGPISELWGFSSEREVVVPAADSIKALLWLVDYRKLRLNAKDTTVAFTAPGMRLDLGGAGAGYAVDRAVALLKAKGLKNFLINASGDIYAFGRKANQEKWRVGVQHPRNAEALLAKVALTDHAIATSGDYERCILVEGKRYHHIFDPLTGYPAEGSASVTVVAPTSEEADMWSTYVFIIGYLKFRQQKNHPHIKALVMASDGKVEYDAELRRDFELELLTQGSNGE